MTTALWGASRRNAAQSGDAAAENRANAQAQEGRAMAAGNSAAAVANHFLARAPLAAGQIHCLAYIAHGWHLGFTGGPLFAEPIEAWASGVVVPSLHKELFGAGDRPVTRLIREFRILPRTGRVLRVAPVVRADDQRTLSLLGHVWRIHGHWSPQQLSAAVLETGSPWRTVRRESPDERCPRIPDDIIRAYFSACIRRQAAAQPGRRAA